MKLSNPEKKKILLAGSSHTRMLFIYVKDFLQTEAMVSRLSYDAGNTAEILGTIGYWPLEDKNIVHVYTGHRDLMPDEKGRPFIAKEQFGRNLKSIAQILLTRTKGKIIFSNIPPVADSFLKIDPQRNKLISDYNQIIAEVASQAGIPVHDFNGFVVGYQGEEEIYSDGLHFTRKFYRIFAAVLADFIRDYCVKQK